MSWRALVLLLSLSSLPGCVLPPGLQSCELGLDGGGDGCLPRAPTEDDGAGDGGAELVADGSVDFERAAEIAACNALVEQVCGADVPAPCHDAPACAAARLLQTYESSLCADALSNDVTYPDCRPGPCALLVDQVCGGPSESAKCAEAPGCDPAKELWSRSSSSDAQERGDAEASCNAALEDDVVFAPCE